MMNFKGESFNKNDREDTEMPNTVALETHRKTTFILLIHHSNCKVFPTLLVTPHSLLRLV